MAPIVAVIAATSETMASTTESSKERQDIKRVAAEERARDEEAAKMEERQEEERVMAEERARDEETAKMEERQEEERVMAEQRVCDEEANTSEGGVPSRLPQMTRTLAIQEWRVGWSSS
jgi:hypothetical protein